MFLVLMFAKENIVNYFIDIIIKSTSEKSLNTLLNILYTKLHKIFCDLNAEGIGVSFPKYHITLGNVFRIHGDREILKKLLDIFMMNHSDYSYKVSDINPIPDGAKYRVISRKQPNMSQAKMKRLLKRGSIINDEIHRYKAKFISSGLNNPYFELISESNGHKYRRYIEFGELLSQPIYGKFDEFGLSKIATIPWFD